MAVIADIIEGSLRHNGQGYEDTRVFIVKDIQGSPSARKWAALNASGVPRRGDSHPVVPGISVQDVDVSMKDGDPSIFTVSVNYGGDTEGTAEGLEGTGIKGIEISTSTATVTTSRDINGEMMIVRYEGPTLRLQLNSQQPPEDAVSFSAMSHVVGEYDVQVLRAIVTVERSLPALSENRRYALRTNAVPWSGAGVEQWLLLGVDSSVSGNGRHDWRYQLALTPDYRGWRLKGDISNGSQVWNLPNLPEGTVEGNGLKYFQLYETFDFARLGFQIPT